MSASSSAHSCCSDRARYTAATTELAVAQIAQSVGIHTAQPAALRSLSDLAGRYVEALGKAAASYANSQGRTECNILDVVLALEELASPRGFTGASMPRKPFLQSAVLDGIIAYVNSIEEVPFPRSINCRRGSGVKEEWKYPSFALAGKDPPPHVPRWLPLFPEPMGEGEVKKLRIREDLWPQTKWLEAEFDPKNREGVRTEVCTVQGDVLPSKRPRVRFKLGLNLPVVEAQGIGPHVVGNGKRDCLPRRWESEEDGSNFTSSAKDIFRYELSMKPFIGLGVSSGFPD